MKARAAQFPACARRAAAALAGLALLSACSTYQDQTAAMRASWSAGNVIQAAALAERGATQKDDSRDALLWFLEAGAATRAAGRTGASVAAFNRADAWFAYWDARAKTNPLEGVGATLVNQTVIPYRGTEYDKIMESTYQALNYLQLGQPDRARVEINRALQRQRDAVAANAARIAAAEAAAEKSAGGNTTTAEGQRAYNAQRAQADPVFRRQMQQAYGDLPKLAAYSPYVNPFTVYLEGLYFLHQGVDLADFERARKALERARELAGSNPYLDADYELAVVRAGGDPAPAEDGAAPPDAPAPGPPAAGEGPAPATATAPVVPGTNLTYVIFETGMAPTRREVRLDIPLFIVTREVPYVGVNFPQLQFNPAFAPSLEARAGGASHGTVLLCNMDAVVAQDFENELPAIVVQTLITAGAKAAASYGIYQGTKDAGFIGALAQIGFVAYQAATNQADLRTWVTLPKQFQYCRFETPADRRLRLTAAGGGASREVDLPPGDVIVVYVKSTSPIAPLLVQTFVLR